MPDPNLQATADDVADAIITFELHIEQALASCGHLTTTLTRARSDAGLAMGYGQPLFAPLPVLLAQLVAVRGTAGELHKSADVVARTLRITAGPPVNKDDPPEFFRTAQAPVRTVVPV